jgi:prophage tail gpP-like protein
MALNINFKGQTFSNFVEAKVGISLDNLTGSFYFESTADENENFPIKKDSLVEVLADGSKILTGYVDKINVSSVISGGKATHKITIGGRGILQDLLESTVSGEYTNDLDFVQIVRDTLNEIGLVDVKVINKVKNIKPFGDEIESGEIGVKGFDFLEACAKKRQLLLNENKDGNLVIQRASKTKRKIRLLNIKNNEKNNNIKRISFSQDSSNRFYKYIFESQLNPVAQRQKVSNEKIVSQSDFVIDKEIRKTRQLQFNSDLDLSYEELKARAVWEANVRRARSFVYECIISGHTAPDGKVWDINNLIFVVDSYCNINSDLLIKKLVFSYNSVEGSTTTIGLTLPDAYSVLLVEENSIDNNTRSVGGVFVDK